MTEQNPTTLTFQTNELLRIGDIIEIDAPEPTRWQRLKHWLRRTAPLQRRLYRITAATTAVSCSND